MGKYDLVSPSWGLIIWQIFGVAALIYFAYLIIRFLRVKIK